MLFNNISYKKVTGCLTKITGLKTKTCLCYSMYLTFKINLKTKCKYNRPLQIKCHTRNDRNKRRGCLKRIVYSTAWFVEISPSSIWLVNLEISSWEPFLNWTNKMEFSTYQLFQLDSFGTDPNWLFVQVKLITLPYEPHVPFFSFTSLLDRKIQKLI